tara:strand:+ start:382 stop:576 length:195 start_codon:yes stop_codon:yes gene_type:complete
LLLAVEEELSVQPLAYLKEAMVAAETETDMEAAQVVAELLLLVPRTMQQLVLAQEVVEWIHLEQ